MNHVLCRWFQGQESDVCRRHLFKESRVRDISFRVTIVHLLVRGICSRAQVTELGFKVHKEHFDEGH